MLNGKSVNCLEVNSSGVLIARCLVQEADYILLDEPFVGIDSVSEEIIMNTLRDFEKSWKDGSHRPP